GVVRRARGPARGTDEAGAAAHPAAHVRETAAGGRCGPARRPGNARSRGPRDHAAVHARRPRLPADRAQDVSSARLMPELPDIALYLHAITARVVGARLERLRIASPFLLRTADPPVADLSGRTIHDVRRLGKRIVLALDEDLFIVLHLRIAGRLHWKPLGVPIPRRAGLAAFDFPHGTLLLTEAGTKHRASPHVPRGARAPAAPA